ncbi:MAG TPA: FG-GAP-like repeat-containing protein [Candidatus Didemnitutus sp.]
MATTLTGAEVIARGTNIAANHEAGEPLHAGNAGGSSVWWKWTAPSTGIFAVNVVGATFDTLLGIYTGTTLPTLSPVASNDDISGASTGSSVRFAASTGITYYIAVDGKDGATGTFQLQVTDQFDFLPPYPFTTLAGKTGTSGSTDATGTSARFNSPSSIAIDGSGNVYVADKANHTIRKITSAGVVSTIAGLAGSSGSIDGTATSARFNSPSGIAIDGSGNLYVADTGNHTIRMIDSSGNVTTLAGTAGFPGVNDGLGSAARFNGPAALAVDPGGTIYVADTGNSSIRAIAPGGVVSTFAGVSTAIGNVDGVGSAALFYNPAGIAVDAAYNIYVADTGSHTIRKITPDRTVITFAGTAGLIGSTDGIGAAARFFNPAGVGVDPSGSIYVADTGNHLIRYLTASQRVITIAGAASTPGSTNASGLAARFNGPRSVELDAGGNLYVADTGNQLIRKTKLVAAVPAFTKQPANQIVTPGQSIAVTASGTGWPWASLQWYKDGQALQDDATFQGTNSANLAITSATAAASGAYRLAAQNASGTVNSSTVNVTVVGTTTISQAVLLGNTASFAVISSSPTNSTYQWQRLAAGTTTWVNLTDDGTYSGTMTATLMITGTNFSMNGDEFRAVVTNSGVVIDSSPAATLSLEPSDMNGDGSTDLVWQNTSTGDRSVWLMNGISLGGFGYIAGIPTDWSIVGTGDFNGDGQTDLVWENLVTGDRTVWYMNGLAIASFGYIGGIPGDWHIAAVGDFDGDGKPDLVWENSVTGDRTVWLLDGTNIKDMQYVAGIDPDWHIVGAADLDGDGHTDLVWENLVTGDRTVWYMNGADLTSMGYIANVPGEWHIAMVADMDRDGHPDLVWEDRTTGDRAIWLMNDATMVSSPYLAQVDPAWDIAP